MSKIRVLVVDDSLTVRKRLVAVLSADPDCEVIAEAAEGRAAVDLVPPATLTFVRWTIAFAVLLPFVRQHLARDWPAIRRHLVAICAFALMGSAGYNVVAYLALHYTQAINSLLLQSVSPLFVALGASRDPGQSAKQVIDGYWMGLAKRSIELV